MSGVKSISRHEEASAGGGSFAQQGVIIALNILGIIFVQPPRVQLVQICHKGGSTETTVGPLNKYVVLVKNLCCT